MVELAIVIVSFNVCELLRRCLYSVYKSEGDLKYAVCVVDNNSSDDSADMIRLEFPQVELIVNKHNAGYPAANNQGLRHLNVEGQPDDHGSPPRHCLLLNPDTELPANALAFLVGYMDANPGVGVVGPKLVMPNGKLDLACRRSFPTPIVSLYRMVGLSKLLPKSPRFGRYNMTYLDEGQLAEVDSVVGAFMMVRTSVIQQVGLLDEKFWMYGEDLDWAKRIKDRGWKVFYNPGVEVLHVKRASSKGSQRAQIEFYRAMLIFYYKHYYQGTSRLLHWLIMVGIAMKGGRPIWADLRMGASILNLSRNYT